MKEEKKKPRGTIGHIIIRPDRRIAEFIPVEFPRTKAQIERYIIERALTAATEMGLNPYELKREPIQNPENSFDFTLTTETGEQYLDLMEVAPLEQVRGSYEGSPNYYNNGEFADFILSRIISKSQKYGKRPKSHIHLLLYNTDWRFHVDDGVLNLLAYYSQRAEQCFRSILYFSPSNLGKGNVVLIHPRLSETFHQFNEVHQRRRCTLAIDVRDIEGSITFGPTLEDA